MLSMGIKFEIGK